MPYAQACECPRPLVFTDDPETCQRCGRWVTMKTTESTGHLALSIAEIAAGRRHLVEPIGSTKPSASEDVVRRLRRQAATKSRL